MGFEISLCIIHLLCSMSCLSLRIISRLPWGHTWCVNLRSAKEEAQTAVVISIVLVWVCVHPSVHTVDVHMPVCVCVNAHGGAHLILCWYYVLRWNPYRGKVLFKERQIWFNSISWLHLLVIWMENKLITALLLSWRCDWGFSKMTKTKCVCVCTVCLGIEDEYLGISTWV